MPPEPSTQRVTARAFMRFQPQKDFWVGVTNSVTYPRQELAAGETALVRDRQLTTYIAELPESAGIVRDPGAHVPIAGIDELRHAAGRSVLILLPSPAVGDGVAYAGAIRELAREFRLGPLAVAFTGFNTDLWPEFGIEAELFPQLLPEREIGRFDLVVDFASDIPALNELSREFVAIDEAVLRHFGLPTSYAWTPPRPARPVRRVTFFPIASTPLRMLPPRLVGYLARELGRRGFEVEVILDDRSFTGAPYLEGAPELGTVARLVRGLDSVQALAHYIRDCDYGVFCDSGPAHITKLYDTPGLCLYTTIAAAAVRGSFRNLALWQARYAGRYCRAPCGLTGAVALAGLNTFGCMDTLQQARSRVIGPLTVPPEIARRLLLEAQVGCTNSLIRDHEPILATLLADIASVAAGTERRATVDPRQPER